MSKYFKIMIDGATDCCIETEKEINFDNVYNILQSLNIHSKYSIEKIIEIDRDEAFEMYDVVKCDEIDMRYKIFLYFNDSIEKCIDSKAFNKPQQIKTVLTQYEGYWCKVLDLSTSKFILEGAFDSSFLDEEYYK